MTLWVVGQWFSALLEVFNNILPNDNNLPKSMYEQNNKSIRLRL